MKRRNCLKSLKSVLKKKKKTNNYSSIYICHVEIVCIKYNRLLFTNIPNSIHRSVCRLYYIVCVLEALNRMTKIIKKGEARFFSL